jgi:hypothetical protein
MTKTIQEEYKEWAVGLYTGAAAFVDKHANVETRSKAWAKVKLAGHAVHKTGVTLVEKYANAEVRRKVGKGIVKAVMVALIFERDLIDNKILPRLNALVEEQEPVVAAQPVANVAVAPVEKPVPQPALLLENEVEVEVEVEPKVKFKVLSEDEGLKPIIIREPRKPKAKAPKKKDSQN